MQRVKAAARCVQNDDRNGLLLTAADNRLRRRMELREQQHGLRILGESVDIGQPDRPRGDAVAVQRPQCADLGARFGGQLHRKAGIIQNV